MGGTSGLGNLTQNHRRVIYLAERGYTIDPVADCARNLGQVILLPATAINWLRSHGILADDGTLIPGYRQRIRDRDWSGKVL